MVCRTIQDFEKRWKKIGEKIEKKSFTREQAKTIIDDFFREIIFLELPKKEKQNYNQLINEIVTSLNVSLQISVSNYERFAKPSLIQRIFGKPEVNIDFNAIKNKL